MESLAVHLEPVHPDDEPIELLIADDDELVRSLVAARARDVVGPLAVYEAADGRKPSRSACSDARRSRSSTSTCHVSAG